MRSGALAGPEHVSTLILTPHAPGDVEQVPTMFGGTGPRYPRYWRGEGDSFKAFRLDRCISYFSAANALGITPLEVRGVEIGRFQFSQLTARRLLQKAVR